MKNENQRTKTDLVGHSMQNLKLPFIKLPKEFVALLKSSISVSSSPAPVFDVLRANRALVLALQDAFREFDDGRGIEKILLALGWESFKERMASIFVFRELHGRYPAKTSMELVEDIKAYELLFASHGIHTHSRTFLLAFYLKIAGIHIQKRDDAFPDFVIPSVIGRYLSLSQGRAEKTDWLILILWHFHLALGEPKLMSLLSTGKKFHEIYGSLPKEIQERMHENLLAYGASVNDEEIFLYDKI